MLVQIDAEFDVWVDHDIKALIGLKGLESTFMITRIQEGIQRGQIRDVSFKRGKRTLLIYCGGWGVVTHVASKTILSKITEALKESRGSAQPIDRSVADLR